MNPRFEKAQALYREGRFLEAKTLLEALFVEGSAALAVADVSTPPFDPVLLLSMLLRCFAELENFSALTELLRQIEASTELRNLCSENPRYFYCRALGAYFSRNLSEALELNQKSLNLALERKSHLDLGYALIQKIKFGMTGTKEDLLKNQKDLRQVELIAQELKIADLLLPWHLLECELALSDRNFDRALEKAWLAYELAKETDASVFYAISTIASIGHVYLRKNDHEKARLFLKIADKSLLPASMPRLHRIVQNLLQECSPTLELYDLFLDVPNRKVFLNSDVEIDLKNQFVLIDFFLLFLKNPGHTFDKRELAEKVWAEEYHPMKHDNLIYVTLRRARSLLENKGASGFILRTKTGYQLNPQIKAGYLLGQAK